MKKKIIIYAIICMVAIPNAITGCGKNNEQESEPIVFVTDNNAKNNTETVENDDRMDIETSYQETEITSNDADEIIDDESLEYSFEDLANYSYEFSSGAGGWSTDFNIEKDGYFHGNYHDSDMGVTGDGYEGGTVYSAVFTGHFSGLKKVDEYAYEMTLSDISYKDEGVEEEIIDDVKYIYVDDAYGISGTQRYLVYFPGTPLDIFDEEISSWIHADYMDESVLQTPVIVNVDQNYGIYSYERLSASEDAKMNYDSYIHTGVAMMVE